MDDNRLIAFGACVFVCLFWRLMQWTIIMCADTRSDYNVSQVNYNVRSCGK